MFPACSALALVMWPTDVNNDKEAMWPNSGRLMIRIFLSEYVDFFGNFYHNVWVYKGT